MKSTITVSLHMYEISLTNHNKKYAYISIIQCYLLRIIINRFMFPNLKYLLSWFKNKNGFYYVTEIRFRADQIMRSLKI